MGNTLKEISDAFKIAGRIISASEPLTELGKMSKETRGPSCSVCGDSHKVGAEGHEIDCPSCMGVVVEQAVRCMTCRDTKKVGSRGHQVQCPLCK